MAHQHHHPRTLQGNGGGRIPMDGFSYAVSRHELEAIIDAMPTETCRAMHLAARQGDTTTAQRLLREAAATYYANSSVPVSAVAVAPCYRIRQSSRTTRS